MLLIWKTWVLSATSAYSYYTLGWMDRTKVAHTIYTLTQIHTDYTTNHCDHFKGKMTRKH